MKLAQLVKRNTYCCSFNLTKVRFLNIVFLGASCFRLGLTGDHLFAFRRMMREAGITHFQTLMRNCKLLHKHQLQEWHGRTLQHQLLRFMQAQQHHLLLELDKCLLGILTCRQGLSHLHPPRTLANRWWQTPCLTILLLEPVQAPHLCHFRRHSRCPSTASPLVHRRTHHQLANQCTSRNKAVPFDDIVREQLHVTCSQLWSAYAPLKFWKCVVTLQCSSL